MMSDLEIKQSSFFKNKLCKVEIREIEEKYDFINEIDYFQKLVNFSTAKLEPYQRWVRYREGYSTLLVEELIRRADLDKKKYFIADPMVGSGSTIISATKCGYDSLGIDINPYCELIITTKLLSPKEEDLRIVKSFLNSLPQNYYETAVEFPPLSDYFPKKNLINLLEIREKIDHIASPLAQKILLGGWFFILENCSNRKKDGNGLATRPAPVTDVISYFKESILNIITDYTSIHFDKRIKSNIITGSAKDFYSYSHKFEEKIHKKLGAVIFSPPYANAFDYFESYKMELLFGRLYQPTDYLLHKKEQIRNYRISYGRKIHCDYTIVELLCNAIEESIPIKEFLTGKRDSRTRLMPNMLRGYFSDMGKVLKELYMSLDENGHCYIVVDQSSYVGVIVPTDIILAHLAETTGFKVNNIIICRKASTSAQQRKKYPYLSSTLRESIVSLQKLKNCR